MLRHMSARARCYQPRGGFGEGMNRRQLQATRPRLNVPGTARNDQSSKKTRPISDPSSWICGDENVKPSTIIDRSLPAGRMRLRAPPRRAKCRLPFDCVEHASSPVSVPGNLKLRGPIQSHRPTLSAGGPIFVQPASLNGVGITSFSLHEDNCLGSAYNNVRVFSRGSQPGRTTPLTAKVRIEAYSAQTAMFRSMMA